MKLKMKPRQWKKQKKMVNGENLFYEDKKDTYSFRQLDTIKCIARNSISGKIT